MKIKPWTVHSSKVIFHDKFIKHRLDHCIDGKGNAVENYHVLEFPDWINVVGLTEKFELILVSEYRHGGGKVFVGFPSGTAEGSDHSIEETARRELEEETGYVGGYFQSMPPVSANPATQTNRVWTFLATGLKPTGTINLDPHEEIEVFKRDYIDFLQDVDQGTIELQGLHHAALALANYGILKSHDKTLAPLKKRLLLYWEGL